MSLMTKRSTIGTNPLDEAIPNPLEATIPDQPEGKEQSTHQEEKKQKDVDSSSHRKVVLNKNRKSIKRTLHNRASRKVKFFHRQVNWRSVFLNSNRKIFV